MLREHVPSDILTFVPERSDAITRATADAAAGDLTRARMRLRGYLVSKPSCREARLLLAEFYRRDGHLDEAGRWGYLYPETTPERERAAYEHSCAHRLGPQWRRTLMRRGLHWPSDTPTGDPVISAILARLDAECAQEARDHFDSMHRPWRLWWRRFLAAKL